MVVIYFFLMFFAIIWIAFCLLGMMAILVGIVEYGRKFKPEGWVLAVILSLLLLVGCDWGFNRAKEVMGAMKDEAPSQSQSE